MRMKHILLLLVLIWLLPATAGATTWNYLVNGFLENNDAAHEQFAVTGNILIDDQTRTWNGNLPTPAPSAPADLGNGQFSYFISGYDLKVGDSTFSGDYGSFYIERIDNVDLKVIGDLMWSLEDGSGGWKEWIGENFGFFHGDGGSYDLFNEMGTLAPIIQLTNLDYLFNDPILTESVKTDIWLTRTNPRPEPATLLLLGSGIIGFFGLRRMSRRNA